ncbi:MAG: chorismate synthase [SAR86 cluster bacterium BACL1 MAG-121105-bin34]|jgi:chorismate synthase|uniref:Chorismate synthase n=2 Tax=SAR86 cluster TaxID=62672 RepID=A0A0R2U9Q1_9GAMM|nr:MAG: chorismate synthase [SAR86 cluster bacterium BACL1 MAG-120507-bin14]KRO41354.1 MAG: chorismate synthase [SAR86 cluster bacterium BACL1 MAG-120920-bin57]KRO96236.1 MAG: chorismate synthase [SAR86 cluster bacterium BACL1 MAG-120820-bin45]KRO98637.1 MAG: chorismate synthase [SAR86 cluster bacterium BACL1 MAG-120823-bin87]KRO99669.1 MAG: chorismate synthase [SAR86 cluster bacterium BACL1 MAG-120813-bin36]KRP03443.1 MAG: chorismate synthase [SAR86 cluster bacterium BACL1 MAG-120924-bin88]K
MSGNTFGTFFKVTTYGESHGKALGCIIDGCPPQLEITTQDIQLELDRRKPGQSDVTTQRKEDDKVEILSGVFAGKTTGTPISLIIYNEDQRSGDYANLQDTFRPNHADITYHAKYGHRDYRGGGRSSARETAMRVAAGAVAKKYLNSLGVQTTGYVSQIGSIKADSIQPQDAITNKYFFADTQKISDLDQMFAELIKEGNSVGAKLGVCIENCPVGLGAPVFDKLDADLAKAIMSINAVKSVSIGNVAGILDLKGSEIRDEIRSDGFVSNNAGGILGGISNGDSINIEFLIKPTSSIKTKGQSINTDGEEVDIEVAGRHDPCVGLRAVPIAEAMSNLVIMDHFLRNRAQCGDIEQSLPFKK